MFKVIPKIQTATITGNEVKISQDIKNKKDEV